MSHEDTRGGLASPRTGIYGATAAALLRDDVAALDDEVTRLKAALAAVSRDRDAAVASEAALRAVLADHHKWVCAAAADHGLLYLLSFSRVAALLAPGAWNEQTEPGPGAALLARLEAAEAENARLREAIQAYFDVRPYQPRRDYITRLDAAEGLMRAALDPQQEANNGA